MLHVTDVHLDMQFVEGAEVHCDERPCCRPGATREGHATFPDQVGCKGEFWRPPENMHTSLEKGSGR